MAMRTATMSHMNTMDTPVRSKKSGGFIRKFILLNLLMASAVLGIVLLNKYYGSVPQIAVIFFADACLGLVAGFGCRLILLNRNWFLVSLVSIFLVLFGMILIGDLTQWFLGIGPIYIDYKVIRQIQKIQINQTLWNQIQAIKVDRNTLFDFGKLDWFDLIQLGTSLFISGLALNAWRRKAMIVSESASVGASAPRIAGPERSRQRSASIRPATTSSGHWFPKFNFSRSSSLSHRNQFVGSPEVKMLRPPLVKQPRRKLFYRRPKIEFALVEEHKCPFCLEPVTHNDPRGVKECEVCHTLHHADCWDITGVCQVPHLNT